MNDASRFARALNAAGASKRYLDGGKRSMTVVVSVCGVETARKTIVYTRGKVTSEVYSFPAAAQI